MVENTSAAYLYKVASILDSRSHHSLELLKSYYLMKCKEQSIILTKQFSPKFRCSHCCIEWKKETQVKVKPIRIGKSKKRRMRLAKKKNNLDSTNIPHSNQIEQICAFCKQATTTTYLKPENTKEKSYNKLLTIDIEKPKTDKKKNEAKEVPQKTKKTEINVYSSAKEVFSLNNKNNILASTIKETPKVIKNNKRKKDKYAGLCQKAVLASAQIKQEKEKQNKLGLFLKPST